MTIVEMNRRLATLPANAFEQISRLIREGNGARNISFDTPYSIKQINAVFKIVHPRSH